MTMETKFYTVNELAKILNLTPRTIRNKIKSGEIFAARIGDSVKSPIRIHENELERLIIKGYNTKKEENNEP